GAEPGPWDVPDADAGLYLHVPFCAAICPYCDFAVRTGNAAERRDFAAALAAEAALIGAAGAGEGGFDTVYFGGGTPSALEPDLLGEIAGELRRSLPVRADALWTLEANPEDVDAGRVDAWRGLGFRGVSLGVQSLDARRLRFLGRRHAPEQARAAVERCLEAGFDWVSADLIYGLPAAVAREPEDSLRDAAAVAELGSPHVSAYQLTMEAGTPFGRRAAAGSLVELEEGTQAETLLAVRRLLRAVGLQPYEVSNFARTPSDRSRHNRKYWRRIPYLGLGPSAHSLARGRRWWNERDWRRWRDRVAAGERPVAGMEVLAPDQEALEDLLLGLRLVEGLDLAAFSARHGADLEAANGPLLACWQSQGLATVAAGRLRLQDRGLVLAEGLAAQLELARVGG
ncbi:MAG: radical SAM family heme chaperone HemW, partial [Thermoanaerobaculia bacterium]|nr:radical SAM family heme chaperone HemW [Thermoanaerobaculia bacterium]